MTDKSVTIILDDAWHGRTRTERTADMGYAINQAKRTESYAAMLRAMDGDGTRGTVCRLPFEGVLDLITEAYRAGQRDGLASVVASHSLKQSIDGHNRRGGR